MANEVTFARALAALAVVLLLSSARSLRADPEPAAPEAVTVKVPGDKDLEVVMGPVASARSVVYMHGVCGDPHAFDSWRNAASRHATLVSLRGELKCKTRPGRTKWTKRLKTIDERIARALTAVSALRATPLDPTKVTLLGYSQGAMRVEAMAHAFPELHNDRAAEIMNVPLDRTFGTLTLRGNGQVVAVADSGLDNGDNGTIHPDFRGRVDQVAPES